MSTAYDSYVRNLKRAWTEDEDDERRIMQPGERLTVSMSAMDAQQRQIADESAMPAQSRANAILNQEALDQARRDGERVQGLADGYTDLREQREQEARDENPARAAYVADLNTAWMNPPNAGGMS